MHHPTPPQPGDGPPAAGAQPAAKKRRAGKPGLLDIRNWAVATPREQLHPAPPPRLHAAAARAGAAEMYGSPATTGEQAAAHLAAGSGAIPPAQAARGSSLSPAPGQAAQTGQPAAAAAPMPSPPASTASSTPQPQPRETGAACQELVSREASGTAANSSGGVETGVKKSWSGTFCPCVHPPTLPRSRPLPDRPRASSENLREQRRVDAARSESQQLERSAARAGELRVLLRQSLRNLEGRPDLAKDALWKRAVINHNHELIDLEMFIADSPDRGQRYGFDLPFSDGDLDADVDGVVRGAAPEGRLAPRCKPVRQRSPTFDDDTDSNEGKSFPMMMIIGLDGCSSPSLSLSDF